MKYISKNKKLKQYKRRSVKIGGANGNGDSDGDGDSDDVVRRKQFAALRVNKETGIATLKPQKDTEKQASPAASQASTQQPATSVPTEKKDSETETGTPVTPTATPRPTEKKDSETQTGTPVTSTVTPMGAPPAILSKGQLENNINLLEDAVKNLETIYTNEGQNEFSFSKEFIDLLKKLKTTNVSNDKCQQEIKTCTEEMNKNTTIINDMKNKLDEQKRRISALSSASETVSGKEDSVKNDEYERIHDDNVTKNKEIEELTSDKEIKKEEIEGLKLKIKEYSDINKNNAEMLHEILQNISNFTNITQRQKNEIQFENLKMPGGDTPDIIKALSLLDIKSGGRKRKIRNLFHNVKRTELNKIGKKWGINNCHKYKNSKDLKTCLKLLFVYKKGGTITKRKKLKD